MLDADGVGVGRDAMPGGVGDRHELGDVAVLANEEVGAHPFIMGCVDQVATLEEGDCAGVGADRDVVIHPGSNARGAARVVAAHRIERGGAVVGVLSGMA